MIDLSLLPRNALIDTNVLIRGLGERPNDPEAQACSDFFRAMSTAADGRELMIAAPTLSEVLRFGAPDAPAPNLAGVAVVAFDARAADLLGRRFPQDVFVQLRAQNGIASGYYKYDAMIVACAMRWNASVVVALDRGVHALCDRAGIAHQYPAYYQQAQGSLQIAARV